MLAIKTAREHGDLSENFEYHAAKNEQGLLEARIRTLRSRLDNAVLVDETALKAGEVGIGSVVEIEDEDGGRGDRDLEREQAREPRPPIPRWGERSSGTSKATRSRSAPLAERGWPRS